MSYFVYILYSDSLGKYYTGSCENLEKRFREHNSGQSRFTKSGLPWIMVKNFTVSDRREALLLEAKIKKRGALRYLKDLNEG
jgi:putative endonuclease